VTSRSQAQACSTTRYRRSRAGKDNVHIITMTSSSSPAAEAMAFYDSTTYLRLSLERIRGAFCDDALYKLTFTLSSPLTST